MPDPHTPGEAPPGPGLAGWALVFGDSEVQSATRLEAPGGDALPQATAPWPVHEAHLAAPGVACPGTPGPDTPEPSHTLRVRFAAAQVLPCAAGSAATGRGLEGAPGRGFGRGLEAGHLRGLVLVIGGWVADPAEPTAAGPASRPPPPPTGTPMPAHGPDALGDAIGRLHGGSLWCNGQRLAALPLHWRGQGALRLELLFANGTRLAGRGNAAGLEWPAGAEVSPSYRC